jgi:hypothetical protein
MPSTGRSTGTSPPVRRLIRIERRYAGVSFRGGRARRHRRHTSVCPRSTMRRHRAKPAR